ncbi:hypothetical protein KC331_g7 [Hortaea werneckii]|nr:hypothetical protein KC331_g7 [Hortaea werneckii]
MLSSRSVLNRRDLQQLKSLDAIRLPPSFRGSAASFEQHYKVVAEPTSPSIPEWATSSPSPLYYRLSPSMSAGPGSSLLTNESLSLAQKAGAGPRSIIGGVGGCRRQALGLLEGKTYDPAVGKVTSWFSAPKRRDGVSTTPRAVCFGSRLDALDDSLVGC